MATPRSFLSLPHKIRRRIYIDVGIIIVDDELNLTEPHLVGEWSYEQKIIRGNLEGTYLRISNQLFYVSHAISDDARTMFYSENRFWFYSDAGCGLQHLMNMGPVGWRNLRYIVIKFGPPGCCSAGHESSELTQPKVFCRTEPEKQAGYLADWTKVCAQLAKHIQQDDQLELRLVCNVTGEQAAAAYLEPFHSLPQLKACSIRLKAYPDPKVQQMIMATIQQTSRHRIPAVPRVPFRLLDLPLEIQLEILGYAGLVDSLPLWNAVPVNKLVREDCRSYWCGARPHEYKLCLGCYCPSTHTAFSTAHTCWGTPSALFVVNKSVRALAISLFYSRHILHVDINLSGIRMGASWTPQSSIFLCTFPEYSWPHLRHIYWKLGREGGPEYDLDAPIDPSTDDLIPIYPSNDELIWDWTNTVYFIKNAFPLGQLKLELDMSRLRSANPDYVDLDDPDAVAQEWALYDKLIEPMVSLRDLQDLFIHIYWPAHPLTERLSREEALEQRVMGRAYDSVSRGKKPASEYFAEAC